jgi:VWFA-related protein
MKLRGLACVICAVSAVAVTAARDAGRQPQEPAARFRSGARLVPVNVVVHDQRGRPVEGLTVEDFSVRENGQPQEIALFSVESRAMSGAPGAPPLPSGTYSNRLEGPTSSGVTVILFDRLNTSGMQQLQARDQIVAYLKQLRPDDRVGFYVLEPAGLRVMHDFTRDASSLLRALDRAATATSAELAGSETGREASIDDVDPALTQLLRQELAVQAYYQVRRAETTVEALEGLAARLAAVRGRKSVVWVSGGFPLLINDGVMPRSMSDEVRRATRALSTSDVAIYTVDARGLIPSHTLDPTGRPTFTNIHSVNHLLDGMRTVAEQTGGRAFFNRNDLGRAVEQAIDDTSLSYVLAYYSSAEKQDGRFRSIKIDVNRRGVNVRHRPGYYAHPPVVQDASTRREELHAALRRPLDATGLELTARVEPGNPLTVNVHLPRVGAEQRGDTWVGEVTIMVSQAMPDGTLLDTIETTIPIRLTAEDHAKLAQNGLRAGHEVRLADGAHQVRIAVYDAVTRGVGSLSIPASDLRKPGAAGRSTLLRP